MAVHVLIFLVSSLVVKNLEYYGVKIPVLANGVIHLASQTGIHPIWQRR